MKPTNKRKDIWVILGILALLFGSVISYDAYSKMQAKKVAKYNQAKEHLEFTNSIDKVANETPNTETYKVVIRIN